MGIFLHIPVLAFIDPSLVPDPVKYDQKDDPAIRHRTRIIEQACNNIRQMTAAEVVAAHRFYRRLRDHRVLLTGTIVVPMMHPGINLLAVYTGKL